MDKAMIEFKKDLLQMLILGLGIDKEYAEANANAASDYKKFISLVDLFNKKYKNIQLKPVKKTTGIGLQVFLNEKDVKDVFANSASKIIGVQSIGANRFGAAPVTDQNSFTNELQRAKNKLHITYYSPKTGTSNVFLQFDKKEKKVELIYDLKEIENDPSPEFQIAAFYAHNQSAKKIDLHNEAATLGFSSILSHAEKAEWFERYDPNLSE
jgi:hypothetical protein